MPEVIDLEFIRACLAEGERAAEAAALLERVENVEKDFDALGRAGRAMFLERGRLKALPPVGSEGNSTGTPDEDYAALAQQVLDATDAQRICNECAAQNAVNSEERREQLMSRLAELKQYFAIARGIAAALGLVRAALDEIERRISSLGAKLGRSIDGGARGDGAARKDRLN